MSQPTISGHSSTPLQKIGSMCFGGDEIAQSKFLLDLLWLSNLFIQSSNELAFSDRFFLSLGG
jgi:hypothetical protein